jgi:hypothetical protein
MFGEWRGKTGVSLSLTALLLLLFGSISGVIAQEPPPDDPGEIQRDVSIAATVNSRINYQGILEENGTPVNGSRDMTFDFFTNDACSGVAIYHLVESGVSIGDGYFDVAVDVPHTAFYGEGVWLEVTVDSTTLGCEEILPVPYALSLRPGATIAGIPPAWQGGVFNVDMTGTYPAASAIDGTAATGSAVRGESLGGNGVLGTTENGYGVYGYDGGTEEARGYAGYFYSENGVGVYGQSNGNREHANIYSPGVYGKSTNGVGVYGRSDTESGSWTSAGVMGWSHSAPGGKFLSYNGNLIEGWEDVWGDGLTLRERFKVTYNGNVYADQAYHCGLGSGSEPGTCVIQNSPADFAEVLPAREDPEPGDVLVIATDGVLLPSSVPYQNTVVGIYSTQPGYVGNGQLLEEEGNVPLAVVGLVPVKASAENGPIQPGDLLTSAASPGHAMRAGENPPAGTVVGKALEALESGTGIIQMLVMLQ